MPEMWLGPLPTRPRTWPAFVRLCGPAKLSVLPGPPEGAERAAEGFAGRALGIQGREFALCTQSRQLGLLLLFIST